MTKINGYFIWQDVTPSFGERNWMKLIYNGFNGLENQNKTPK